MPKIGEVKRAAELGYKGQVKYTWLACEKCGKERWARVIKGLPRNPLCPSHFGRSAEINPNWKGGEVKAGKNGCYIAVKLQPGNFFYPMANKNGYALEHRLVMAKHLNRCLLPWEVVHHKPGYAKDDNRYPETLQLFPSQIKHMPSIKIRQTLNKLARRVALLETENAALKASLKNIQVSGYGKRTRLESLR